MIPLGSANKKAVKRWLRKLFDPRGTVFKPNYT
jgi:hypothetical protein